jgi:hypothetical protein
MSAISLSKLPCKKIYPSTHKPPKKRPYVVSSIQTQERPRSSLRTSSRKRMLNLKQRIRTKISPEIGLHPRKHIIRQENISLDLLVKALGRPGTRQAQSVSPIIQRLVPIPERLRNKARQVQGWKTEYVGGRSGGGGCGGGSGVV